MAGATASRASAGFSASMTRIVRKGTSNAVQLYVQSKERGTKAPDHDVTPYSSHTLQCCNINKRKTVLACIGMPQATGRGTPPRIAAVARWFFHDLRNLGLSWLQTTPGYRLYNETHEPTCSLLVSARYAGGRKRGRGKTQMQMQAHSNCPSKPQRTYNQVGDGGSGER